jgi:hypothetical protein
MGSTKLEGAMLKRRFLSIEIILVSVTSTFAQEDSMSAFQLELTSERLARSLRVPSIIFLPSERKQAQWLLPRYGHRLGGRESSRSHHASTRRGVIQVRRVQR